MLLQHVRSDAHLLCDWNSHSCSSPKDAPAKGDQVLSSAGRPELDILLDAVHLGDFDVAVNAAQRIDDVEHKVFRRGCARGQANRLLARDPGRVELAAVGDEIARDALLDADLAQPVGVGTVLRAHHEDHVGNLAQIRARRIAGFASRSRCRDVSGPMISRETALERVDDACACRRC